MCRLFRYSILNCHCLVIWYYDGWISQHIAVVCITRLIMVFIILNDIVYSPNECFALLIWSNSHNLPHIHIMDILHAYKIQITTFNISHYLQYSCKQTILLPWLELEILEKKFLCFTFWKLLWLALTILGVYASPEPLQKNKLKKNKR